MIHNGSSNGVCPRLERKNNVSHMLLPRHAFIKEKIQSSHTCRLCPCSVVPLQINIEGVVYMPQTKTYLHANANKSCLHHQISFWMITTPKSRYHLITTPRSRYHRQTLSDMTMLVLLPNDQKLAHVLLKHVKTQVQRSKNKSVALVFYI